MFSPARRFLNLVSPSGKLVFGEAMYKSRLGCKAGSLSELVLLLGEQRQRLRIYYKR